MGGSVIRNVLTVANGATTSAPLELGGNQVVGIIIPASVTGTSMTFEMAVLPAPERALVSGDWRTVRSTAGTSFTVTYAAGDWIVVDPDALSGTQFLRLVVSAQAAAREFVLLTRPRL